MVTLPAWAPSIDVENSAANVILKKRAKEIANRLSGADSRQLAEFLNGLRIGFNFWTVLTQAESASAAKEDLLELAARADELTAAIKHLGPGAYKIMVMNNGNTKTFHEAQPWDLPNQDPISRQPFWKIDASSEQNQQWAEEFERGGRWLIRLEALANLSREKANWIAQETRKGGRISFGARLYTSPEEHLAKACRRLAEEFYGQQSQAFVVKLMSAVLEAEYRQAPPPQACRSIVRAMFKTNQK